MKRTTPELGSILDNIQTSIEQMEVRIPEAVFVRDHLPILANTYKVESLDLRHYVELVGGVHRTALVVNEMDEPILRLPPLFPRVTVKLSQAPIDVMERAHRRRPNDPHAIDKAAEELRRDGKLIIHNQHQNKTDLEVWKDIFAYYGVKSSKGAVSEYHDGNLPSEKQDDDDFFLTE